ncbi:unnamed protein product [Gongylonema pulchrum]|uniref:CTNNB1_binding domain-containing protein n=1 Tax=Gongylonema pulchrum TaxID=637853 RepID=A0A183E3S3_9BILA|nr:unnamed protein product [Gongylonema pulchrum]
MPDEENKKADSPTTVDESNLLGEISSDEEDSLAKRATPSPSNLEQTTFFT